MRNSSISPTVNSAALSAIALALLGRFALLGPVGAVGRTAHSLHQRVPAPPEGAHLQFVLARRLLAAHAAGNVRPCQFAPGCKAALAAFQCVDVVRCAEPRGAEERDEVLEAPLPQFRRLAPRQVGPGVDLDVIGYERVPGADRVPGRDQDQIREDEEVPAVVGDAMGLLGTDPLDEPGADLVE